jgi:asparagine synthase (glutamine-hydrolysing)
MPVSAPAVWVVTASREHGLEDAPIELTAANEEYTVLADGELYERDSLARELGLQPCPSRSDAELVLAAYARWGAATPERLKGVFSIAAWNRREQLLQAVRDPLGVRPLFRYEDGATILLSNSIAALTRDARVQADVNRVALAGLLSNRLPDHEETFFTRVRRVPQGHVWDWGSGGSGLRRYWDPLPPAEPLRWAGTDELEEFDALLERAVTRTLSEGPVGVYLSGGIDSVAVAAYARDVERRTGGRTPWAFSLVFPEADIDEGDIQRAVASSLELPQLVLPLDEAAGPEGLFGAALALAADWPSPLLNPWLPAYHRLSREAVARGCRTILTGGGGDEWLIAGPYWAADLLRAFRLRKLAAFAAAYRRSYPHSRWRVAHNVVWRFGLRPLLVDAVRPSLERRAQPLLTARLRRNLPDWFAPDSGLRQELYERRPTARSTAPHGSIYVREGRRALEHPLVDFEMEETFESGIRTGARIRQPFWDADLLALLYRIHPDELNRGGRSKGLVREALDRRFPDCGFKSQRKVVSTHFFQNLVARGAASARRQVGPATALAELGIVDPARLEADFDRILRTRDRWQTHRIWDILLMETWLRSRKGERDRRDDQR